MKVFTTTLLLFLLILSGYGQACGVYQLQYTGEISSDNIEIEKVRLPTISFLHGLEKGNSESTYVEAVLTGNNFEIIANSPLTSVLYTNPNEYKELYKSKRQTFPVVIVYRDRESQLEIEKLVELEWDEITIQKMGVEYLIHTINVDLKTITLEH